MAGIQSMLQKARKVKKGEKVGKAFPGTQYKLSPKGQVKSVREPKFGLGDKLNLR